MSLLFGNPIAPTASMKFWKHRLNQQAARHDSLALIA